MILFKSTLKYTLAVSLVLTSLTAFAASDIKKVSGNYTYYGDKNDSPAMAKRKALEGARLDAISQEFGTIVTQDVLQADRVGSNGEDTKFFSLSSTEVKGEWIADNGDPVYVVSLGNDDCLIVNCRINGTAKAITNESVEFEAIALRNGSSKGNATTEYHSGDDLFVYFTSPVDGYVSIFLMGENGDVNRMLPYQQASSNDVKIKKNYEYTFFDPQKTDASFGDVDEFAIGTNGEIEFNKLYVLFSPAPFSMPVMHAANDKNPLPYLTEEEFNKWLSKSRRNDAKMGVKQINLKLFPN